MLQPTQNKALVATIAAANRRLGKHYLWSNKQREGGVWHDGDDDAGGEWLELPMNVTSRALMYETVELGSLRDRAAARRELAYNPNYDKTSLISGVVREDARHEDNWFTDKLRSLGLLARRAENFDDIPTYYLTLDCDNLDLRTVRKDVHVLTDIDELPDLLDEVLDASGLDFLITNRILHYSSRFGILDQHTFKAHCEWHLRDPLTLAQQSIVAEYCNAKTIAAGFGRIFDNTIYHPGRYLFTRPAELTKRVWLEGHGIVDVPVDDPVPYGYRVRLIENREDRVELPDEVLAFAPQSAPPVDAGTAGELRRALIKTDTAIKPGNVYAAVRARICAVALETPAHKAAEVKKQLEAELTAEIQALPDHCAEKWKTRRVYVTPKEIERSWSGAIARSVGWHVVETPSVGPAYGAAAARASLAMSVKAAFESALAAGKQVTDDQRDGSSITPLLLPIPQHVLFRVAPGVGKTEAVLGAIDNNHLSSARIGYLTPTVELSAEVATRRKSKLPSTDIDYWSAKVRHHQGREKLCKEKTYGALAKRFESVGLSPSKAVCGRCPIRDACAWPTQSKDKQTGLVCGQHAHATSTYAKLRTDTDGVYDVAIIDESPLSTLLTQKQPARSLAALSRAADKTAVRDSEGKLLTYATADVRGYRHRLFTMLRAVTGAKLPVSNARFWRETVTVDRNGEKRLVTMIEDAISGERGAQRSYRDAMTKTMDAIDKARQAGRKTTYLERQMAGAQAQIVLSAWLVELWRAIEASIETDRQHVFGVRITGRGVAKRIQVHIRTPLPSIMEHKPAIWLDGTANAQVWKAYFGKMKVEAIDVPPINVAPGPYHLTQYPDKIYSKKMFTDAKRNHPLDRLRRFIRDRAAAHSEVLVVAQKEVQALLEAGAPANVRFGHFNALKGLDKYRNVPCGIIIGRPSPSPGVLETLSEALYFDDEEVLAVREAKVGKGGRGRQSEMSLGRRVVRMVDGSAVSIRCETHPDPKVEALRDQIVGAEVRQALHRLRLFDRTEANPAEIHVFGQEDLGLPVHALGRFVDVGYERTAREQITSTGMLSPSVSIMRKLANGLLDKRDDKTVRRLYEELALSGHSACEDQYTTLSSLHTYRRNVHLVQSGLCNAHSQLSTVEVLVRTPDMQRAEVVFVDAGRHAEPERAVLAALGDGAVIVRRREKASRKLAGGQTQ